MRIRIIILATQNLANTLMSFCNEKVRNTISARGNKIHSLGRNPNNKQDGQSAHFILSAVNKNSVTHQKHVAFANKPDSKHS